MLGKFGAQHFADSFDLRAYILSARPDDFNDSVRVEIMRLGVGCAAYC